MITQDFLKKNFDYDHETGIFFRLGRKWKNQHGFIDRDGYIRFRINKRLYGAHRMAWIYIYGVEPKSLIDHINGNKSDNRIVNLREATHSQNLHNAKRSSRNTSGVKGVSWVPQLGKWVGRIHFQYKKYVVGYFDDLESAESEMIEFRKNLIGEFARHD